MATYYWVGGNGAWNNSSTANWAVASGGAGGSGPPTGADSVVFDVNSGSGAVVTVETTAAAGPVTINKSDITLSLGGNVSITPVNIFTLTSGSIALNGFSLTVGYFSSSNSNSRSIAFGGGNLNISGSGTNVFNTSTATNFAYTGAPSVNFTYSGSSGTRTVSTGGTESNVLSINVLSGSDGFSFANGSSIKSANFSGYSGTVLFGNGTFNVYGDLTFSPTMIVGGGNTSFRATSGVQTVLTAGRLVDIPLTFNGVGGTVMFQDALVQGSTKAFTITNGTVKLKDGVTSTVGVFATTGTNQKFLQSTLAGSQATLLQTSGTVNATYLTIKDISATGGATWNAFTTNNNVDAGNNLGWDFSTQVGRYIFTTRKNKRILP